MGTIPNLPPIYDEDVSPEILLVVYDVAAPGSKGKKASLGQILQGVAIIDGSPSFEDVEVVGGVTANTISVSQITVGSFLKFTGGATVRKILKASLSIQLSGIAAESGETRTITVSGALTGDHVNLSFIDELPDGVTAQAWVSSDDTVSIKFYNQTTASIGSATFTALVALFRFS